MRATVTRLGLVFAAASIVAFAILVLVPLVPAPTGGVSLIALVEPAHFAVADVAWTQVLLDVESPPFDLRFRVCPAGAPCIIDRRFSVDVAGRSTVSLGPYRIRSPGTHHVDLIVSTTGPEGSRVQAARSWSFDAGP
jgi:hypothetical protein